MNFLIVWMIIKNLLINERKKTSSANSKMIIQVIKKYKEQKKLLRNSISKTEEN